MCPLVIFLPNRAVPTTTSTKMMPPIGRAMKPMVNVLNDMICRVKGGAELGKNKSGKTSVAMVP